MTTTEARGRAAGRTRAALSIASALVLATSFSGASSLGGASATASPSRTVALATGAGSGPEVNKSVAHDTSPTLRTIAARAAAAEQSSPDSGRPGSVSMQKPVPGIRLQALAASNPGPANIPDPTGAETGKQMPAVDNSFEGLGQTDQLDPNQHYYPPDTDGDVGPNHYVQMVNVMTAVFNKQTGAPILGPINSNLIWLGFDAGNCATNNDGDPIVQYDQLSDRWLISQFSVSGPGNFECVAVSTTPDPTGSYHRYAFQYTDFPDYPKFGVWPDGYYVSYNMFDGNTFQYLGAKVCSLQRSAMLAGKPASQQCFQRAQEWSLLPSDSNGTAAPPAGSPNYVVGESWDDNELLTMYKFHVDWSNPAASTFTGPINLPVNAFTWACVDVSVYRGQCIPQPDSAPKLESLGARAMYRLAYRNFGDHESLLLNHTVAMDSDIAFTAQTGLGWYELRDLQSAQPTVYQQGTSADSDNTTYRWMASLAQDKQGNMALGYSKSKSTVYPSIAYVGRLAADPLNTMPQAESVIQAGTGAQTGSAARWGDYSSMQVDPLDDCTFYYTNEYLSAPNSAKNWRTRIASFKYPGCTGTGTAPGAPTAPSTTSGNASLAIRWAAGGNGDLPVVGYTATATPGGATCSTRVGVDADPLTCTLTGLTNGTAYSVEVTARNALGLGPAAQTTGTPATKPGAATNVVGTPGNGSVALSWTAPTDTGGSTITGYTATATPGGATCSTPAGSSPAPTGCTVTGLTNGQAYTFVVMAHNLQGTGSSSAPSSPVTPATVPTAPGKPVAAAGDGEAAVTWTAPPNDGGSAVTGYTATATPGGSTCSSTGTTACVLTGLANATEYRVSVTARNSAGTGPASGLSDSFTPVPNRVLQVSAPSRSKPGTKFRAAVAGAGGGCRVTVSVKGSSGAEIANAAGTALVALKAPRPNRTYTVTARQSGDASACPAQTATTSIRVKGPYISGPNRAAAGQRLKFRGKEFRAGKAVRWKVTRAGRSVDSASTRANRKGTAKAAFTLQRRGTYAVKASQKGRTAKVTVRVGG